jgi:hypothetical protein
MLQVGEVIQKGDEYQNYDGSWTLSDYTIGSIYAEDHRPRRRPIKVRNPENIDPSTIPEGWRFVREDEIVENRSTVKAALFHCDEWFTATARVGMPSSSLEGQSPQWSLITPISQDAEGAQPQAQQDTPREDTQKRKLILVGGEGAGESVEDTGHLYYHKYSESSTHWAPQSRIYVRRHIAGVTCYVSGDCDELDAGLLLFDQYKTLGNKNPLETPKHSKEDLDPKTQFKRQLGMFLRTCALVRMPDPTYDGPSQGHTLTFQYGKCQDVCEISPEGTVDYYDGTTTEITTPTLIVPLP